MSLKITSSAFEEMGKIPRRYGGDGENQSPPLEWGGAPPGTKQLALICHDPDAPLAHGFTHWVVYGIPPSTESLPEGESPTAFVGGLNDAGALGYTGPYPPAGHGAHHYNFSLYALDVQGGFKSGLTGSQLLDAMKGHVLEQARLVGTYER